MPYPTTHSPQTGTSSLIRQLSILLTGIALFSAPLAYGKGAPSVRRPLDDFLAAQGTTTQFVPPVADYVGWADEGFIDFTLIDYAGLANEFIETESGGAISLNTQVRGAVIEREKQDGRAVVRVLLFTRNALAWGFLLADADFDDDPLPFLNTPLSFGARAQDVLEGAEPSLAITSFNLRFTNSAPGAPLPDLVQLINEPQPEQLPLRFSFRAVGRVTSADGTPSILKVLQVCKGELDDEGGATVVCGREAVDVFPLGGGS